MSSFGNNNNNKRDKKEVKDVNTRAYQMYSLEGFDPSTIVPGYWEEAFTLKAHPALDKSKRTENLKYDYEKSITVVFSPEIAIELIDIIDEVHEAVKANYDYEFSRCVSLKDDAHRIEIGNGFKYTKQGNRPYVAIYKNLDSNKIAEQEIAFEFLKGVVYQDYNNKTGTSESSRDSFSQLLKFKEYLKGGIDGLSKGTAHAVRQNLKYVINGVFENQALILEKLGIRKENKSGFSAGGGFNRTIGASEDNYDNTPETPSLTKTNVDTGFEDDIII